MLWVPQKGVLQVQHNMGTAGTTNALGIGAVYTGNPSSTKGTPIELIASTSFDSYLIEVWSSGYGLAATTSQGCLDILIGAATEEVLIPNLLMGFSGAGDVGSVAGCGIKRWVFPLYIPAGSRISAQAAGDRISTFTRVGVKLYGGNGYPPFRVGGKVTTYGITTVPAGTDVAAGYSGAQGSWVEIAASTSLDHFAFCPSFHPTDGDTTLSSVKNVWVGIGIGSATEEFLGDFRFRYDSGELCEGPFDLLPLFYDVPSGTRLVARVSVSGVTDTGEPDVAIHAVS